jgi:hypothetical protein
VWGYWFGLGRLGGDLPEHGRSRPVDAWDRPTDRNYLLAVTNQLLKSLLYGIVAIPSHHNLSG